MEKRDQDVLLQVEYVPLPVGREVSWRAGISLLLQVLKSVVWFLYPEAEDEFMGIDADGDLDGSVAALFSLAYVTEGEEVASIGGLYAWVVGHDGSVHRMALADW